MWVTTGRLFQTERLGRPEVHVSPELRERIAQLSSTDQVRLERELRSRYRRLLEELVETYPEVDPAAEEEFVAELLPDEFVLQECPGDDIVACIMLQVSAAPLRWKLDLVGVAGDYVSDFGPSYWKWRWINARMDRADAAATPT
ncbi:hypothetical protein [Agromyces sp. NPDC055661]